MQYCPLFDPSLPLTLQHTPPLQVAGSGIPPKHLLVVVSQWHDALVVRCYDFLSGAIRQAERPDPDRDSALLLEFKVLLTVLVFVFSVGECCVPSSCRWLVFERAPRLMALDTLACGERAQILVSTGLGEVWHRWHQSRTHRSSGLRGGSQFTRCHFRLSNVASTSGYVEAGEGHAAAGHARRVGGV